MVDVQETAFTQGFKTTLRTQNTQHSADIFAESNVRIGKKQISWKPIYCEK